MQKLLIICGPTAIGKTSTGIKLAKKYNGEIISADSRQVYKNLDIGTGKDIKKSSKFKVQSSKKVDTGYYEIDEVPVWLLDMAEPDQQVTVAEWLTAAEKVISNLRKEDKLPIVVGGTGFYIQGLTEGIDTLGITPDENLRERLSEWPVKKLQKKLEKLDSGTYQSLNQSDRNNPHRLIRKIEIARAKQKGDFDDSNHQGGIKKDVEVLKIGLRAPREVIYKRIDKRVEKRLELGLLEEIKNLLDKSYSWDDPGFNTFGYKEFEHYYKGNTPLSKIVRRWKYDEHGYARRQITWFKQDEEINWFDVTADNWFKDLKNLVENWYSGLTQAEAC